MNHEKLKRKFAKLGAKRYFSNTRDTLQDRAALKRRIERKKRDGFVTVCIESHYLVEGIRRSQHRNIPANIMSFGVLCGRLEEGDGEVVSSVFVESFDQEAPYV